MRFHIHVTGFLLFYGFYMIKTVLYEEKGTRRKDGRGGRRDEEDGATRRKELRRE